MIPAFSGVFSSLGASGLTGAMKKMDLAGGLKPLDKGSDDMILKPMVDPQQVALDVMRRKPNFLTEAF